MDYVAPEQDFPAELHRLSPIELRAVAEYHARVAHNLQQRAKRLQAIESMEATAKARTDSLEASYRVVLDYLACGYNSAESAICAAARDLELPEHTVAGWWRIFCRKRDQTARDERDALIIRLVQMGFKNYEIAARLEVHTNTVSRAVSKHLHGYLRPVDRARLRKRRKV